MLKLQYLAHLASRARLISSLRQFRPTNHLRNVPEIYTQTRHTSSSSGGGYSKADDTSKQISVTFLRPDGTKITVKSNPDKSLYDAVIDNNVDIDGFGACEGTLCCTTCHLIFKESDYEKMGEPSEEEQDMLDLAYGLTDTSRLGCQVTLRKELDPLEVQIPVSINDAREC